MEENKSEQSYLIVNHREFSELKEQVSVITKMLRSVKENDPSAELFTPRETMGILKIKSPKTLWKYRNIGELPGISFGGKVLFSKSSIDNFIKKYSNQERGIK